ncbi:MAG: lipid-A-disaccharide synthase [Kiritimatiellia bacterium]
MSGTRKILLLAGEESGLFYAERLQEALTRISPDRLLFRGYQTEGFKTGDLAVMGFGPVLKKLFFFLGVARTMKGIIRDWRPDVVVTVDYPGLNLKLAAAAKKLGIPAVHVVCPQVWAWHKNRIPKVAAALTKLLCFFPFEPKLFAKTGLRTRFIGHPMADVFALENGRAPSPGHVSGRTLAILPGSRVAEISRILPRLLPVIRHFRQTRKDLHVQIPTANEKADRLIRDLVEGAGLSAAVEIQKGGARDLLRRADCAVVASGTATLEAALARCPTVLVYAVSRGLAWFARRMIKDIHYIGLANVIWEKSGGAGEAPMPELLQEAFTPEAVTAILRSWLDDAAARQAAVARLDAAMALLQSDGDALGLAAHEILGCIDTIWDAGGRPLHAV